MNRRRLFVTAVILLVVLAFVFLAPVVPITVGTPVAGVHYHYYGSLSSVFSPVGTCYWNGHLYFTAHFNPYRLIP